MCKLLVIDDELIFRDAVVHQLEDRGHQVEVAADAQAGIEIFARALKKRKPFDLVLTDMLMPQAEGFPEDGEAGLMVVEGIQKLSEDALILVMTAHGSIDNAVKAVRLGAYDYLPKPFSSEELQLRLSKALSHQALRRATRELEQVLEVQRQREQQRLKAELAQARRIQNHLMPKQAPEIVGLSIAGECQPATETSGDFYTYFSTDADNGQIGIALADVSGKSLQGAMVGMMAHGMLLQVANDTSSQANTTEPADILTQINDPLFHVTDARTFVCLGILMVDVESRQMQIACAGQWPPLIWRNGARLPIQVPGCMPLGVRGVNRYETTIMGIESGDIIVFYTDGLVEAENPAGEFYGEHRVQAVLEGLKGTEGADEILETILGNLIVFRDNAPVSDDVTVVVMVVE